MSEWFAQAAAIIAALAVTVLPGVLVTAAVGVRGLALWALAPAVSVGVLTGGSLVLGVIGVGWRPLPAIAFSAVVAAVVFAGARLAGLNRVPSPATGTRGTGLLLGAGVIAGIVFVTCRLAFYIGEPDAISQTNDAAFHLSALRFAVETGQASPLELSGVTGAQSFYPSAWHVLGSLIAQLSGCDVTVAANLTAIVFTAVAWPLGVAYLTATMAGPVAAAFAAALSASVSAYPLVLVQWGVLYPQLLAVAILPGAIALVPGARPLLAGDRSGIARHIRYALLLGTALAAVAAAQPSVLLAWAVAAVAWVLLGGARGWSPLTGRLRAVWVAGLLLLVVATVVVWSFFARTVSVSWPPTASKLTAAIEVLTNAHLGYPAAIVTSLLAIIGLVVAVRSQNTRWLALLWLVLSGLYAVAASVGSAAIRTPLVGPWYEDPYRLAALAPVAVIPLAGMGAAAIVAWTGRAVKRGPLLPQAVAMLALVALGVSSLVVSPQIQRRDVFVDEVDPNLYDVTPTSFISQDELALLERLADEVPADAVIVGNPSTGASFGYAVSGRNVIPRTWSPPAHEAYSTLWTSLREAAANPAVCEALDAYGAQYVLDFGPGEVYPGRWVMPGFDDLEGQPGFELVAQEGEAQLWRVTACD